MPAVPFPKTKLAARWPAKKSVMVWVPVANAPWNRPARAAPLTWKQWNSEGVFRASLVSLEQKPEEPLVTVVPLPLAAEFRGLLMCVMAPVAITQAVVSVGGRGSASSNVPALGPEVDASVVQSTQARKSARASM